MNRNEQKIHYKIAPALDIKFRISRANVLFSIFQEIICAENRIKSTSEQLLREKKTRKILQRN